MKRMILMVIALTMITALTGCGKNSVKDAKNEASAFESDSAPEEYETDPGRTVPLHINKKFENWDNASQNIAGSKRYLYADGRKVLMPTTIGEWEELLGIKFAAVCSDEDFVQVRNYSYNNVFLKDQDGIIYEFKINLSAYDKIENDPEEELDQLRRTNVVGLEIDDSHYVNKNLEEKISLVPQGSMFSRNIQEVTENLHSEYPDYVDNEKYGGLECGYTFEWGAESDGKYRKLLIEYIPDNYIAFYRFIAGEIPANGVLYFPDYYTNGFQICLQDVTGDGVDELVVYQEDEADPSKNVFQVYSYNQYNGKLQSIFDSTMEDKGFAPAQCNAVFSYETIDGKDCWTYYMLSDSGMKMKLATFGKDSQGNEFVNGIHADTDYFNKLMPVFEYLHPIAIEEIGDDNERSYEKAYEFLNTQYSTYFVDIDKFKAESEAGKGIHEIDNGSGQKGELDDWKATYLELMHQYQYEGKYLGSDGEAVPFSSCNSVFFNIMDADGDGIPELLMSVDRSDGYLNTFSIFRHDGSTWEDSLMGSCIDAYDREENVYVGCMPYEDTNAVIYRLKGNQITQDEEYGIFSYDDGNMQYYHNKDGENTCITESEFNEAISRYSPENNERAEAIEATPENIDNILGVNISKWDETGWSAINADSQNTVTENEDPSEQEKASDRKKAFDEFLSNNRKALIGYSYRPSEYDTCRIACCGEEVSMNTLIQRAAANKDEKAANRDSTLEYAVIGKNDNDKKLAVKVTYTSDAGTEDDIFIFVYNAGQIYLTFNSSSMTKTSQKLYNNGVLNLYADDNPDNVSGMILDRNGKAWELCEGDMIYMCDKPIKKYSFGCSDYFTVMDTDDKQVQEKVKQEYIAMSGKKDAQFLSQREIENKKQKYAAHLFFNYNANDNDEVKWETR